MKALEALALSRKYTQDTAEGMGAVKGKNAIISNIEKVTGGNMVTFAWYLDDGTYRTESMFVRDGAGIEDKEEIIQEALERAEREIVANASEDYNTLEKIEAKLNPIEQRLANLQAMTNEEVDEIFGISSDIGMGGSEDIDEED